MCLSQCLSQSYVRIMLIACLSPNVHNNNILKLHIQFEWSDWCYWDVSAITSLVQFVLHELHPDDIVTFKVIHGEYTIKDNTCFQLKPNVKFKIIIVVYIGTEAGNEHYSHIRL